ncbi:hypothetical protein ACFSHT_15910 [Paraburkholderia silviterrae]|uniref:Uncharacterized protein n=1 Tax=Paraburkholderia silviterrae TaxID=2528715 RepID=A0A4R5MA45_9BURK|nr:hypothetical protein [Paraburkholderia silviterrae]TDG23221.1 hypothetical protein EYW47_14920 [Paraburkholderia silviterrae]
MIDFDGTLNAAISSTLGDQVAIAYLPQGASTPVTILGIFTLITDEQFDADGTPNENITVATLGLQVSQLAKPPAQGDSATISGVTYAVGNVDDDGLGWAYLNLNIG